MAKEKLYRIKPELRGYFTEYLRDDKETMLWWVNTLVDPSALEEVDDSPKITKIKLEFFNECVYNDGCTFTYVVIFEGKMYDKCESGQLGKVSNAINDIISASLVGKTWDELVEEDGELF